LQKLVSDFLIAVVTGRVTVTDDVVVYSSG